MPYANTNWRTCSYPHALSFLAGPAFAYFAMSLASNNSQLATAAGVLAYASITPFNFVKNIQMFKELYNEFAETVCSKKYST